MTKTRMKTTLALALTLLAAAQAAPVTVTTAAGPLTLPQPATRVVALEYSFLDTLVALGVRPVGAATAQQNGDRGTPPYLRARTASIPAVGSRAQPSLELMAALKPDLILADAFVHQSSASALRGVAPTALFQSRRGSYDDLQQQVLDIGALVGRAALARQLVQDQAGLVAKARKFASPRAPALVAAVATPTGLTLHTDGSFVGSYLEALGRRNLLKPRGADTQYEVSLEGLVALNPATLVVFTAPDEVPVTRAWAQNPLWQKLSAVQRGRVFTFDRDLWTRARGPVALKLMVAQTIESGLLADRQASGSYALR